VTVCGLDAVIDGWIGVRVAAHQARAVKAIGVPRYLDLLRAVRAVEDALDPIRFELGADRRRMYYYPSEAP
jgi:hypothetical protein